MKISTVLDHIDSGQMALSDYQRGHVWSRDQVRALLDSHYRRHKICANRSEGHEAMRASLKEWAKADHHFTLDWLLRLVNSLLTREASFQHMHEKSEVLAEMADG